MGSLGTEKPDNYQTCGLMGSLGTEKLTIKREADCSAEQLFPSLNFIKAGSTVVAIYRDFRTNYTIRTKK